MHLLELGRGKYATYWQLQRPVAVVLLDLLFKRTLNNKAHALARNKACNDKKGELRKHTFRYEMRCKLEDQTPSILRSSYVMIVLKNPTISKTEVGYSFCSTE